MYVRTYAVLRVYYVILHTTDATAVETSTVERAQQSNHACVCRYIIIQ